MAEPTVVTFANGSNIESVTIPESNYVFAATSTPTINEWRTMSENYVYGENNFSVRYGYQPSEEKVDRKSKWYQPIKDWLKFNWGLL